MAGHPRVLTADDALELPPVGGIGGYEFVDGLPVPVTPASPTHGRLAAEMAYRLRLHAERAGLDGNVYSDTGFVLGLPRDPERMRAPDVAWVERAKVDAHADPDRPFRGFSDLAVEVGLTSGRKPGGQQRIMDYLEAGVRLVWSIDPRALTAAAYRPGRPPRLLGQHESLDGEGVIPGFRLALRDLFD